MNTNRMFAFVAAVLITAALFGAIADGFTSEQSTQTATAAHGAVASGGSGGPNSAAD
jgi:hypothetical protein